MCEPLAITAARLRSALAAQDFGETTRLLSAYCQALERRAKCLSPADPELSRLSAEAHELFRWMRSTALCLHAHLRRQRESLDSLSLYSPAPASRHTWNLEG